MAAVKYRINPFRTNQYQRRMIAIPIFSIVILNAFGTFLILFFRPNLIKTFRIDSKIIDYINWFSVGGVIVVWIFFILVTLWAIMVSHNLLGAFERITRDLDVVLQKKKKNLLKVRIDDHPANELIMRINQLIERTDFKE